jgi:hypothetical protein
LRLGMIVRYRRARHHGVADGHFGKYSLFPKRCFEDHPRHPRDSTGYSNL